MPKISIITISLNTDDDLINTIRSVDKQSFKPHQHIIIVKNLVARKIPSSAGKNYRIVLQDDQSGIYPAMNQGLDAASGKYILFLNSGDEIRGDLLAFIFRSGSLPVKYKLKGARQRPFRRYVFGLGYNHQGVVFCNNNLCFNLKYKISADFELILTQFNGKFATAIPVTRNSFDQLKKDGIGHILYQGGGFSDQNYIDRDLEIASILWQKKRMATSIFFLSTCMLKWILKAGLSSLRSQ